VKYALYSSTPPVQIISRAIAGDMHRVRQEVMPQLIRLHDVQIHITVVLCKGQNIFRCLVPGWMAQ